MRNENFQKLKAFIMLICPICSEKFKTRIFINEHLRVHFDEEAEELFKKEEEKYARAENKN